MPAATAKKHACQHANKLKSSTSTTAQAPKIGSTSIHQTLTSPPSTSINFKTFVELANLNNIIQFCDVVASTQEGRNLKLLWDRAFEAGLNQGQTDEWDFRDEMYCQGKPRVSRKQKKLPVVPKLTSTTMDLRKEELKNNPNGPLQAMDPTVLPP